MTCSWLSRSFWVGVLAVTGGCGEQDVPNRPASLQITTIVEPDTGFYQDLSWSADGSHLVLSVLQPGGDSGFTYRLMRVSTNGEEYVPISPMVPETTGHPGHRMVAGWFSAPSATAIRTSIR
jgi:hypothetical protein